mmetsp:Transcript_4779/g.11364  ORF Transcript_4779/g.11364 Transcript_4779/m.11364 type:complete len:364 (+) Transcript_4779:115-1206(+)|eukprot:CAMPEP_0181444246 /NCGR_PEP_ID=MMETSP1110-20121109/24966_1 /TAXON_ID=174948 /ORGANISM="Symbiodinium sp., Strain CCMP421" /LENGTH=363 /DNA_ID=CAMNT_0023568239 /DNA_START=113 /DNA_END=1204 /DNA_ORIENTATION=+
MGTAKAAEVLEAAMETKPLLREDPAPKMMPKVLWSIALIASSAALINYNKYLIHPTRFPYPVVLVFLHMLGGSILSSFLLLTNPALFPALTDPDKKVDISPKFLTRRVLPVGLLFTTSLILSNTAYQYANVAFLQMVKQSNVIIVFVFSLMLGMEQFRLRMALVLVCVMVATTLTVHGEMNFSLTGFLVQLSCNFAESAKVVLQGVLLAGAGRKLDPLSFVATVSPMCALCLGGILLLQPHAQVLSWIALPSFVTLQACGFLLAGNILCAFVLNLVIANYLKHGSPLAFLLTNLVKDAMIVIVSMAAFGDHVSLLQTCAFSAQLSFIALWSFMKANSESFDQHGFFGGLSSALGASSASRVAS